MKINSTLSFSYKFGLLGLRPNNRTQLFMRKCYLLTLLAAIFLMQSCSTPLTPDDFYDQIVDHVKCDIACADYVAEYHRQANTNLFGYALIEFAYMGYLSFVEYINDMYCSTEHTYGDCLYLTANDPDGEYQNIAKNVLKNYNNLNVYLSDFTPVANHEAYKSWSFYELRTNIEFLFVLSNNGEQWLYSTETNEKTMNNYIDKQK